MFTDNYGTPRLWVMLASSFLMVASILVGVMAMDRNATESNCPKRGEAMGRPTKFVSFSWLNYDCYTKDGDGWIPVDKVRSTD